MKREILKLDLADLDFGIYRILNYRRAEIERFFDEELPRLLDEAMTHEAEARRAELEARVEELRTDLDATAADNGLAGAFGADGDVRAELAALPKADAYRAVRDALDALSDEPVFAESEEDRLYNVLYTFFSRYYRDGDFQPQQRRARDARYSVPYNGEDVLFHWRSKGSHYIKTTEELKSYSFRSGTMRVRFDLADAFQEADNIKGTTKFFIPLPDQSHVATDDTSLLIVALAFRPLTGKEEQRYRAKSGDIEGDSIQDRIVADLGTQVALPPGLSRETLLHHLNRYARKNLADYFVHPALGAFLSSELDYFLKNEVLAIEGLTSPGAFGDLLGKLRVIRQVATSIVELLDGIEAFQAQLFEKRRLVFATSYLIPVRLVPEALWAEVLTSDAQLNLWRDDFAAEGTLDRHFLKTHPTLVIDTSLHAKAFQAQVLSCFEDIDEMTDGLLIQGENFGALRTIAPTFHGTVRALYLDPPYNTGNDGFLYRDDFARHSTWLTFMLERLALGASLLARDGVCFVSIDDHEMHRLRLLPWGGLQELGVFVWEKKEKGSHLATHVRDITEYILARAPNPKLLQPLYGEAAYSDKWQPLIKRGNATGILTFPAGVVELPDGTWEAGAYGVERDPETGVRLVATVEAREGTALADVELEGRFVWTQEYLDAQLAGGTRIKLSSTLKPNALKGDQADRSKRPPTLIPKSIAAYEHASREQKALFGRADLYPYPKPTALVQYFIRAATYFDDSGLIGDFFAGSGTTAHAVIQANREDGGSRRFLLVEMGEYFDSVLKRRIAKVMYAPEWENGAPKEDPECASEAPEWAIRSPRLVQILRLENYEDTLNSLTVDSEKRPTAEHVVRYAIPESVQESRCLLTTAALEAPFSYRLGLHTNDGLAEVEADLVTTFNLFKGIRLKRYRELEHEGRRYVVIEGSEAGKSVLVVWRSVAGLDPISERVFLSEAVRTELGRELSDYHIVYHNADAALPNGMSLDGDLKRLMFEPASAPA